MYGSRGAPLTGSDSGFSSERLPHPHPHPHQPQSPFAVSSLDPHSYASPYASPYQSGLYAFPVVRVRGLPFACDDGDMYKFFAGLEIVDCVFVNRHGRFTGDAFVVFPTPVQAQFALQRDRQMMGHRYVEVFGCKKSDYYNAIAAEVNAGGFGNYSQERSPPSVPLRSKRPRSEPQITELTQNSAETHFTEVLKLRGLPYSASKSDIAQFFSEFDVKEQSVHIACRFDGKPTGEAFVEFGSADVAKRAMVRDRGVIGSRYVELFPSNFEEAGRAKSRSR